jgi:hypothetical protein
VYRFASFNIQGGSRLSGPEDSTKCSGNGRRCLMKLIFADAWPGTHRIRRYGRIQPRSSARAIPFEYCGAHHLTRRFLRNWAFSPKT